MTDELSFRHPGPSDLDATLAFLVRCDIDEYGEADTDLADLAHDWAQLDLDRDVWLVEDARGGLIGYAAVQPWGPSDLRYELRIAPKGEADDALAAALLARCASRGPAFARERAQRATQEQIPAPPPPVKPAQAHTFVAHVDRRLAAVLTRAGYERGRSYHQMRIDTRRPLPKSDPPPGVRLRTFLRDRDERAVHALVEAAFAQPDRQPNSLQDWRNHMLRPEIFDPSIWFLAEAEQEDQLLGACLCVEYSTGGWVRQLAVAPSAQGRGIGGTLLGRAFATFHERNVETVALSVESRRPDAHRFYQRTGMTESRRYEEYLKPLS